ncbi:MAG: hypothetical protein EBQ70_03875 [Betaproteobacteria bacterium]|nr:hypothetical protein [Betaproteobacteria bacterium]
MRIYAFIILFFISLNVQSKSLIDEYYFINSSWSTNCSNKSHGKTVYESSLFYKSVFSMWANNQKLSAGKILEIEKLTPDKKTGWDRVKIRTINKVLKDNIEFESLQIWMFDSFHFQRRLMDTVDIKTNEMEIQNGEFKFGAETNLEKKCI